MIDYGEKRKYISSRNYVVDETGSNIRFNSVVDVLNAFSYYGWEVKEVLTTKSGDDILQSFLLWRLCEMIEVEEKE